MSKSNIFFRVNFKENYYYNYCGSVQYYISGNWEDYFIVCYKQYLLFYDSIIDDSPVVYIIDLIRLLLI